MVREQTCLLALAKGRYGGIGQAYTETPAIP